MMNAIVVQIVALEEKLRNAEIRENELTHKIKEKEKETINTNESLIEKESKSLNFSAF